jgi:hypothetical protein
MNFLLGSLAGGIATGVTKRLEDDEEKARTDAATFVTKGLENLKSLKKASEDQANSYSTKISSISGVLPNATQAQLVEIATNPLVVATIEKQIAEGRTDFSSLDVNKLVTTTRDLGGRSAIDFVKDTYKLPTTPAGEAAPKIDRGFFGNKRQEVLDRQMAQLAASTGVSVDQIKAVQGYSTPTITSQGTFNLSPFAKPKTQDEQKAEIVNRFVDAKKNNDAAALDKATSDAAAFSAAEELLSIQKDKKALLINQIMDKPENKKLSAEQQLRKRQELEKAPGEGVEKLKSTDYSRIARGAYNEALKERLGKGMFSIITDPVTGEDKVIPSATITPEQWSSAAAAARKGIIAVYTDSETGKPKSSLHAGALLEIGVKFDSQGNIAKPGKEPAEPTVPPPAAATVAPVPTTPAKPAVAGAAALPLPFTADGKPDKGKLIKGQSYIDNGMTKKWNGITWE